ncbi:d1b28615-77f1-4663-8b83-996531a095ce [Sclerotinia trifoliorum]|uniref:D1b28615-77f1-4663-8b83-996531a095ce n=1 Tax=Sclerotinia trifoliorum TaxID=28548 RepID=A0A8H2ZNA2_9HELO|nr:d1b28615-77f1-4663-8b83-996531a095ce [Sclerotinia trifoliorum]
MQQLPCLHNKNITTISKMERNMYNARLIRGYNNPYMVTDNISVGTARELVAKYFSDMNGQGIRRALTKLLEYTYVFTVVSSVGPQEYDMRGPRISWHNRDKAWSAIDSEDDDGLRRFLRELCYFCCIKLETRPHRIRVDLRLKKGKVVFEIKAWQCGDSLNNSSGEEEEEDKAKKYRDDALRAVMPIFKKMKAPQLRRIINVICGGTYKLDFSAKNDNINNKKIQNEDDDLETLCIDGTQVRLMNEAEACEALEELSAPKLLTILKSLCSGNIVSQLVKKKPIFIDGSTITLQVEGWSELERDDMDSEAEKAEAAYESPYGASDEESEEGSEGCQEARGEYLGDESPTRYFLSRKALALKRKEQLSTCEICKEEYDSTDDQNNCYNHPGNKVLVPRAEIWREHLYRDWTKIKKRRYVDDPAFGQGFSWTCCRKTGMAVGCVVSSHRPKLEDSSNKRTKV